jgi:methyltransferase (TIGR00027 family)
MLPDQASRTAEFMAFFRALESARPAHERLFCDPFAPHFLRPSLLNAVSLSKVPLLGAMVGWYMDRRAPGARTSAIARTRLIDDTWCQALRDGIRQIVILGSGFDCRPYRLPEVPSAVIFEVDHPLTLASKLARLREFVPKVPLNVCFVEVDFNQESLPEVLKEANFSTFLPALFLWEGVTHYLSAEAVDSVLRFVGTLSSGSRILFTYVHGGALDGSGEFAGAESLLRRVAQLGEPWTFGLCPNQVPDFLRKRGLELDSDMGAREYRALYFGPPGRKMKGYEFYHVAIAHVPERGA